MNIFAKLDAYWDSDQCVIDEYRELSTPHLIELRDGNNKCLAAAEQFRDDEPAYWRWRVENGFRDVSFRKPLAKVVEVSSKLSRCAVAVLLERGIC